MGMYDDIICCYLLPTVPPVFCQNAGHAYQSKSLGCEMAVYEITEEGRLLQTRAMLGKLDEPEPYAFHGTLEFYDGNCATGYLGMSFTRNGEDYEWVTYEAIFIDGMVSRIVESERKRETALSCADLAEIEAMFDKGKPEVNTDEPVVGASLYLQWGGGIQGYPVTLLARTTREYIVAKENETTATLHNGDIGRLLFHSQEESDRMKAWSDAAFQGKMRTAKEWLERKTMAQNRKVKSR